MPTFGVNRLSKISINDSQASLKTGLPDWNNIPHRGMERPTEAEFDATIDDLAKSLAEARYQKEDSKYNRFWSIAEKTRAQYISAVSPDRKSLAKDAQQLVNKSSSASNPSTDEHRTIIDYLNQQDGLIQPTKEGCYSVTLNSGTMVVTGSDLQPDTFDLKCSALGQTVMSYSPNGWTWTATPQEQIMSSSFLNRLNSAEDMYYSQFSAFDKNSSFESTGCMLDMKA
ncbi:hypothetical protein [Faecalispora anaeroviscerum]|uniref:hypothetical protein n=1 Tax=Faecalispora anaeroviscerum TaxID=2991836 RepID=UPI0024BAD97A|nr:hypothetical protein [Faecalispora anaeroviscerum]